MFLRFRGSLLVMPMLWYTGCGGTTHSTIGDAGEPSGGSSGSSSGGANTGGCSGSSSGGANTGGKGGGAGGRSSGGSGGHSTGGTASDAGTGDGSPSVPDGGCDDFANLYTVSWGSNGGLVAYQDTSRLSTPRVYEHSRDRFTNAMPMKCQTEVAGCPSRLITDINAGFADSSVMAALKAHAVYGVDSRPVDGAVFRITVGNDYVDVGSPCGSGASSCVAIPPAVQKLADLLMALDAQELAKKACTDVFGTP